MRGQSLPFGLHGLLLGFLRLAFVLAGNVRDPPCHHLAEFLQDLFQGLGAAVGVGLADMQAHSVLDGGLRLERGFFKRGFEMLKRKMGFVIHKVRVQSGNFRFSVSDAVNLVLTSGAFGFKGGAGVFELRADLRLPFMGGV